MKDRTYDVGSLRCAIPTAEIFESGRFVKFFSILRNSTGLTEEYLYAHQPSTSETIAVYSTNKEPIGHLDGGADATQEFAVIDGPVIVVARKGYAGRMYVVEDERLIVHEDAYAIRPKDAFRGKIDLHWFAGHYSEEFQGNRTSFWGIGDFPRERLKKMEVVIPNALFQARVAKLYARRDVLVDRLRHFRAEKEAELSLVIAAHLRGWQDRIGMAAA